MLYDESKKLSIYWLIIEGSWFGAFILLSTNFIIIDLGLKLHETKHTIYITILTRPAASISLINAHKLFV
jgi:hypothetical protein